MKAVKKARGKGGGDEKEKGERGKEGKEGEEREEGEEGEKKLMLLQNVSILYQESLFFLLFHMLF